MFDILIKGGKIVDGTSNPWFMGDIAIKDGIISKIGHFNGVKAKDEIDARGFVVSPDSSIYIVIQTSQSLLILKLKAQSIRV